MQETKLRHKSCLPCTSSRKSTKCLLSQVLTLVLLNKDATPTSNFQPIGLLDPDCCYKFTYLMATSADPDQLASSAN